MNMSAAQTSAKPATGRRKVACARVFLRKGTGLMVVNKKPLDQYFSRATNRMVVLQPLELLNKLEAFDCYITVQGGGSSGQAGAIRHGITRALVNHEKAVEGDEACTWHRALRKAGYVTRDSRMVESKKAGFRKARKKEQYSKR